MSPAPPLCPTPDRLAAFGLGRLPDDEAAEVEEHLLRCEACLCRLGDPAADRFVAALRAAAAVPAVTVVSGRVGPFPTAEPPPHPRYRLGDLLGRGGMGEVYRAHEPSIGRDVAVKLLRGRLRSDPGAVARFLDEARITGRLQHPGVPPVFEVGEWPGGGPFLAMKLIDGRTLAALLAAGPDCSGPAALLAAFEAVCQTVGYAHLHGVIHRDLKPSNVMVGSFGEVQVMDWGLAKDRPSRKRERRTGDHPPRPVAHASGSDGHADTRPGAVLGTPGYMAPEQARGEPADERSDVFALGAILCEILTGRPPHAEGWALERVRLSAAGDLADAFARLDACAADAELVALAKRCLAPAAADRPADGKAVADAVAAYRVGVEDRLRAAERERAAAEARAAEQRKRVRVQLALAGSVLLLVAGGGVGAWAVQTQVAERNLAELGRRQQEERGRAGAEAALARLPDLRERALWTQGEAALDQADGVLGPDGDPDLRGRLAAARADTEFVRQLDRVRSDAVARIGGGIGNGPAARAKYRDVFAAHGFDVLAGDPADLARRLAASALRPYLIAALDDWVLNGPPDKNAAARVFSITAAATGQAWRVPFADVMRDPTRLAEYYAAVPVGERSPGLVYAVGIRLNAFGADGVRVLEAGLGRYPNDFWLHHGLGVLGGKARAVARLGANRAALALRPGTVAVLNNLAVDLDHVGGAAAKFDAIREVIRIDPTYAPAHSNLGVALRAAGDLDGAEAAHREAVRLDPTHAGLHSNLGSFLRDAGRIAEAADVLRAAVALDGSCAAAHANLGAVLLDKGDRAAAEAAFREAVRHDPRLAGAHSNLGAVLLDKGDRAGAEVALREALRLDPEEAAAHVNLGKLLAGRGDPAAALARFREAVRLDPCLASAQSNLALALLEHDDLAGAGAAARAAVAAGPRFAPAHAALARVLNHEGDRDGGIRSLQEAARLDPDDPGHHCNLGHALIQQGRFTESLTAMKRGHELGSARKWAMPSAAWVGQCEYTLAADERFEAFLARGDRPAGAAAAEFGWLAGRATRKRYALASRLFAEAIAADPKEAAGWGYEAAAAAVRCAAGDDPTAAFGADEWSALHAHARRWLRACLAGLRTEVEAGGARRKGAAEQLANWPNDPNWRSVRDPAWRAAMPADDRAAWEKLWADAEAVRKLATGK